MAKTPGPMSAQARSLVTQVLERDSKVIREELRDMSARVLELVDVMGEASGDEAEKARKDAST